MAPKRQAITAREREIFALVAQGYTTKEIAKHLRIKQATVSAHVSNVLRALNARSRTHAVYLLYASTQ